MIGLSIPVASTVYFDQSYEFYKMAAVSPVSRRLYIIEKYLLVLLISSAVFLCGLLCFELYRFIAGPVSFVPFISSVLALFDINLIYRGIDLTSILLKLRSQKRSLSSFLTALLLIIVFIFILCMLFLNAKAYIFFLVIFTLLAIVTFLSSCVISCYLYQKKDL